MKKEILILLMFSIFFTQSEQPYPPLELVSIPTAGTLPKGSYTYETILTKNGDLLQNLQLGLQILHHWIFLCNTQFEWRSRTRI